MPFYSNNSLSKLYTCDDRIVLVCEAVVKKWDNTVLYGFRDEVKQIELYNSGKTKLEWPRSKHNKYPSLAIDLAPYGCWGKGRPGIVWPDKDTSTFVKDLAVWYAFGNYVLGIADEKGVGIRWGGDWDGDRQINDQTFDDLGHFELID